MILGLVFSGIVSDSLLKSLAKEGKTKPEYRLSLVAFGAFFIPMGLFIYGWTLSFHLHWIIPILGTAIFGFGIALTMLSTQTYLIDSFPLHSASALAVIEVLEGLFGGILPLAAPALYKSLGLGWGNSLVAFITLLLALIPVSLLKWGERLRVHHSRGMK